MNVLLSVNPVYAEAILSGTKKYEFRRTIFRRKDVKKIYVYSNSTVRRIVGSFEIGGIMTSSPSIIWKLCHKSGGISKKKFFEYFDGSEKAYCIKIRNVIRFDPPVDPCRVIRNFKPPQSFSYFSKAMLRSN